MHHTATNRRPGRMARCCTLVLIGALGVVPAFARVPATASQTIVGLGSLSFPTSTRSAPAQSAFVRGLLLLHLFEYADAASAFQQAEKLDPGFAMAYWGEAMTTTAPVWGSDNVEAGRAVLAKLGPDAAARAAKAPSGREKAWLAAAEALFGAGTLQERDSAYLHAMERLARDHPDDEAQLFHALALFGVSRGERHPANYLKAAQIAKQVLARNPRHPGAAHYWIHGMDDPEHAAGALEAAAALAKIAPDAPHAQHMTSHIFIALGRWEEVVAANQRAFEVSAERQRRAGQPVSAACSHSTLWLQYAYYQLGRHRDAQQVFDACLHEGRDAVAWARAHPQRLSNFFAGTPEALQRYVDGTLVGMRAATLVELAPANAANAGLLLETADLARFAAWDAFARGWSATALGNLETARAGLAHLRALAQEPAAPDDFPRLDDHLAILDGLLDGAIAARDGKPDAALAVVAKAAAQNDAIPFVFGPPTSVKPPHEFAGELLLQAGKAQPALVEFDRALKDAPRRALSLLGRARALKALGNAEAAARAYAELAAIWIRADDDLPTLAEVRQGAAAILAATH